MSKKIFLVLTALALPAVWFLITPGGYEPHDLHHLADIHQMHKAFTSGQIPPRLGPDFLFGFGYPLFNYYYVLPFYLGSFFYALTGSLMIGFKLVFLLSALISVYGMYQLLNKFFGKWASLAGAALYLYTPFRAVEIYVRGAIGEALAIALLPWVLYFLVNLIRKTSGRNIALTALSLALFYLTHNYFFLITVPFIALFVFILIYNEQEKAKKLKALLTAGILSAGLSAYWWLPAFAEYKLVAANTPFAIIDHFPFIKQLIFPSWGYGSSVWGPYDLISFQIGLVNLIAVFLAIFVFFRNRNKINKPFLLGISAFVIFAAAVFMMNVRSLFIWNFIPFTNFIQFPWRLLALTTFVTAFISGFVIDSSKYKKISAILLTVACLLLTFSYFRPSKVINNSEEHYTSLFFGNPKYSEDYLQLPLFVEFRPTDRFPKFGVGQKAVLVNEEKLSDVHWKATIDSKDVHEVRLGVIAFPGWFVKVDGQVVETYPMGSYGQLSIKLDKGVHEVELYWAETKLRLLADTISLGSFLALVFLYLRAKAPRATI